MPRKYRSIYMQKVDEYLAWLETMNRSPVTIEDYRFTLGQFHRFLNETEGLTSIPNNIGQTEVEAFLRKRKGEIGAKYYQTQIRQLKVFFRFIKNDTIENMHLEFSTPPRPNVNWLSQDEATKLLRTAETPMEELIVHLGLELGLRMIEIRRLRVQDFNGSSRTIDVLGKGRHGGKWRTLPYHKETERILNAWLAEREMIIAKAGKRNPQAAIPDSLIVRKYSKGMFSSYSKGGMGRILKRIVKRAGINPRCAYHTLRRTLGRTMYNNGVRIEKIAQVFGHSNPETTLLYIGINIDDMAQALEEGSRFR